MFKRWILVLFLLWVTNTAAQTDVIFLPLIVKGDSMAVDPILIITDGTTVINLLGPGSGWALDTPYWNPKIAKYKGGGSKINPSVAEGQRLVNKEYDNVVETIPLTLRGTDQNTAMRTLSEVLALGRQAADYWTEPYEYDDVWIEARLACSDCYTGYARIIQMSVPELSNPYGQPFFSANNEAIMNGITLIIEREPLWRAVPPGEIIGPLYNLIDNPDFELWNFGVTDSQPDSWTDLETIQITGTNGRDSVPHSGSYDLKVQVLGSTLTGRIKGVSQVINDVLPNTQYTIVAWVRSDGVSNGVGRILVTYSSQLELYRSSTRHGWTLYTGLFTTGASDTVAISLEILTTAANTVGTVYFDSLMLIAGDWTDEAEQGVLPYISGSHIQNHFDQSTGVITPGAINWVDVWSVPGNEDALVRLEVSNNTSPANTSNPVELYSTIRIGMRRTGNVLNFANYFDPTGPADATASSGDRLESSPLGTVAWQDVISRTLVNNIPDNVGRFRVLMRAYDAAPSGNPTLRARLSYFVGAGGIGVKNLDGVDLPVRAQWCIVNLTPNAGMVQEQKFAVDFPSQLGYTIQMRRSTGGSIGYIDYIMAMPVDGGYLEANFSPPLSYKNALIIDNTASQSVGATQKRVGWNLFFNVSGTGANTAQVFTQFNGAVFIGANDGEIYRSYQGTITQILKVDAAPYFGSLVNAFEVYNGRLYAAISSSAVPTSIWSTIDGITWSPTFTLDNVNANSLKSFAGLLFIGSNDIFSWNGTTLTKVFITPGVEQVGSLEPYKSVLYAGTTLGNIYKRDNTTGNWTLDINLGAFQIRDLQVFRDKLYATATGNGRVYVYDGLSWQIATTLAAGTNVNNLAVLNNKLYAITDTQGTFVTSDGITWITTYSVLPNKGSGNNMGEAGGQIYVSEITTGNIYILTEDDTIYKIANYSGTPFTSPPQKRHRFFFSYDRPNFINNIADKALIGLGFVPRYLTLRGKF